MLPQQPLRSEAVGDIEGEVSPQALTLKGPKVLMVTHEIAVRFAREDDFTNPLFALFMDAGAHRPKLYLTTCFLLIGPDAGHGGPEFLGVFVFRINHAGTPS